MIKLYSHQACSWCQKTKNILLKKKLNFNEYDISLSDHARNEMFSRTGQIDVPVVDIDGVIIVGFNPIALEIALKTVNKIF